MSKILILIAYSICTVQSTVKLWNPPDINNPWKYYGSDEFCANKTIVYAKDATAAVLFPNEFQPSEIVFPATGALIIPTDIVIKFQPKDNCKRYLNYVKWNLARSSWLSPRNWKNIDDPDNQAIPDTDRIPCECDIAVFPEDESIVADVWTLDNFVTNRVKINGKYSDFSEFLTTEIGQLMFRYSDLPIYQEGICNPPEHCRCHSHQQFSDYMTALCYTELLRCEVPRCLDPITPFGHCCPVCGASIMFNWKGNNTCIMEILEIKEIWEKILRELLSGKYIDLVDYHISIMSNGSDVDNVFQLVLVDKKEFNGHTVDLINELKKNEGFIRFFQQFSTTLISGPPYDLTATSKAWLIIFTTLAFVLGFFGLLYVHYVKQPKFLKFTRTQFGLFSSPFMFARFDNTTGDCDTDSVIAVSCSQQTRYDSTVTGFENPLSRSPQSIEQDPDEVPIQTIEPNAFNNIEDDNLDTSSVSNLVEVELDSNE